MNKIKFYTIKERKFGFLNEKGKEIISPLYYSPYDSEFIWSQNGFIKVCKNQLGLLDESGELVIPCEYEDIVTYDWKGSNLIPVKKNGKFGFYNLTQKTENIPCIYDEVIHFPKEGNFTGVKFGDKYAFISKEGVLASSFLYDDIKILSNHLFGVKTNDKYGIFDLTLSKVSPYIYEWLCELGNGTIGCVFNEKWGLLDSYGSLIVPPQYDKYEGTFDNIVELSIDQGYNKPLIIHIFNEKGIQYKNAQRHIYYLDGGYRYFYENIGRINNNGKWSHIKKNGELLYNRQYDWISEFNGGFACYRRNGKTGILNIEGKEVIEECYDKIFTSKNGFKVSIGHWYERTYYDVDGYSGKWGVMNIEGNLIFPVKLSSEYCIKFLGNGLIAIQENKLWGIINNVGKYIILPSYNEINEFKFSTKFTTVKSDENWGLINEEGKLVMPLEYKSIIPLNNRYVALKKDNYYQLWDTLENIFSCNNIIDAKSLDGVFFALKDFRGWQLFKEDGIKISDVYDEIRILAHY